MLNLRGVPLESIYIYIYISCSPWRHSLLLSRGRLALSGWKAGVRRVGMIATLAKAPRAFDSVRKRGRTPTDQSPVWQGPSHFQWDACALSLTPQITSGDCDYASDVSPLRRITPLGVCIRPPCLTCPPWQCIPSPTHLICIALEGAEGIGGAMALEVVPAAAGRLHSDQYSKIL